MELPNDVLAFLAGFETGVDSQSWPCQKQSSIERLPGKTDASTVSHAVTKDLARDHMVVAENGIELLYSSQK